MQLISSVSEAEAFVVKVAGVETLFLHASGTVPTSGWSGFRLVPVFYLTPPPDGLWEFDFVADEPHGIVLQVISPASAATVIAAPGWVKGVKVKSAAGSLPSPLKPAPHPVMAKTAGFLRTGHVIVKHHLGSYDDSTQPTGTIHWKNDGPFGIPNPHIEMKKLHHDVDIVIEGPDQEKIEACLKQALTAGVLAAIAGAIATGGLGGASAGIAAAQAALISCLGAAFSVRIDTSSHWIFWDT